jgi:pimeloyl-ACP methyl ester carboxylesterase
VLAGVAIIGIVLFLRSGTGPEGKEEEAPDQASIVADCPPGEGLEGALCGTLEVPEDRSNPEGRTIALNILVMPASEQGGEPDPVFILAGGPGQAATELAPIVRQLLPDLFRRRDFVFVDQRGTGESNPLTCDFLEDHSGSLEGVPEELTEEDWRECLDSLDASPEHYTTPVAMDDLEDVRVALGYGPINLWGGSYGTRAATVFLRRYPESVRSVVLDGVAPVDMRIPLHFAEDGQRAMTLLTDACASDPRCAERFPNLKESIETLLASLDHDPPPQFRVRHPRTGDWEDVPIGRDVVAGVLRAVLYSPGTASLVPLMVESALEGDFGPLMTLADPIVGPQLAIGIFLSVLCAEDIPFLTVEEAAEAAEESFLDEVMAEQMEEACSVWPRGALPDGYREPVRSDAPVLILSGELDPVTPPRWGEHAAATLPNSRHLVAPGTGHGTLRAGCVPDLIGQFFDAADASGLDADCLGGLTRPPFWRSATGPGSAPSPEP